jgi:hypothetical protein
MPVWQLVALLADVCRLSVGLADKRQDVRQIIYVRRPRLFGHLRYFCRVTHKPALYHTPIRTHNRPLQISKQGLSRISGRFIPRRPEEPVLGKPKAQHRLFTAVREIPSLLSS